MPARTRSASHDRGEDRPSQRLILCFDGTGNKFLGTPGDTNIVKLYNMFERSNANQMHYYQPGIGTYPAEGPVNVGFFRGLLRRFEATIDQALATSFDSHVIAGYRFLMRYYNEGDRIYIFGFSRGAFTARFLARMVSHVGLLSRGNDEMANFAYQVYQEYEQSRGDDATRAQHEDYMNSFKRHFCRTEITKLKKELGDDNVSDNESGIKVHFLGLFDCVNSVGTLDVPFFSKTPPLPAVRGTAHYVRHAVAIDERRVKFKAALFAQERPVIEDIKAVDPNQKKKKKEKKSHSHKESIKEVWFPGNHGDVGGGWDDVSPTPKTTGWLWWKKTEPVPKVNPEGDKFQLSDIALKWMMDELDDVDKKEEKRHGYEPLAWEPKYKESFMRRFHQARISAQSISAKMHDTMAFKGGSTWLKVIFWNFMEWLPIIKRWEYVKDREHPGRYRWEYVLFPLNKGDRRDIPSTALFHHAVRARMSGVHLDNKEYPPYIPNNDMWIQRGNWRNPVPEDVELDDTHKPKEWQLIVLADKETHKDQTNGLSDQERLLGKTPVFEVDHKATLHLPPPNPEWTNGEHKKEWAEIEAKYEKDWDNIYHVELHHT